MDASSFYVTSPAHDWVWWRPEVHRVVCRVSTRFDDPGHPVGQWSVGLVRPGFVEEDLSTLLHLQFLAESAPWRSLVPGTVLPCFYGIRPISNLVVVDDRKFIIEGIVCCECDGEVVLLPVGSRGRCLRCGTVLHVVRELGASSTQRTKHEF